MKTKKRAASPAEQPKKKCKKSSKVEVPATTRRATRTTVTKAPHGTASDKPKVLDKASEFHTSQKVNLLPPTRRITRLMTTDVPRRAALDTTEILENVLSFLSPRSLFAVQRVSRQWKGLIARSPPIQEKMFLRCQAKAPEVWMLIGPKPRPSVPPGEIRALKYSLFESRRMFRTVSAAEVESGDWKGKSGGAQQLFTPVTLNPWLRRRSPVDENACVEWSRFELHSSLRNTYLTDPPCKEVTATMGFQHPWYHHHILGSATIRSDKPLTLRDIVDGTLASTTWRLAISTEVLPLAARDITMAEKLEELKGNSSLAYHHSSLHLQLVVNGTTNHALVLEADQLIV